MALIFRGSETKQVDIHGSPALPDRWYWEPDDYNGDILWSDSFNCRDQAEQDAEENEGRDTWPCPEPTFALKVYESDGSDGYEAGTWGYQTTKDIEGVEYESRDGGWPSREDAIRAALDTKQGDER